MAVTVVAVIPDAALRVAGDAGVAAVEATGAGDASVAVTDAGGFTVDDVVDATAADDDAVGVGDGECTGSVGFVAVGGNGDSPPGV